MVIDDEMLKKARAAIESEVRVGFSSAPLKMEIRDGKLCLDGEVQNIAAKRLVLRLVKSVTALGTEDVIDGLQVVPVEHREDGEILNSYTQLLMGQVDLRNCCIRRKSGAQMEVLHDIQADDRSGEFTFFIENGVLCLDGWVISLSHKRIAELLAWWVPGCRNVINRLAIAPAEGDSDDEVNDAVRLALEMDPLLAHADQINVSTNQGIVALQGIVASEEERHMAEFDAWCIAGVNDVQNRLQAGL